MVNSLKRTWRSVLVIVMIWVGLTLLALAGPAAAVSTAPRWQLTGQSADGLSQQYVDLNSLRAQDNSDGSQWIVDSYFIERKANEQVRADYVTLYDCDRHLYKDVNDDGRPAPNWGAATADPLNLATLNFVCERVADPEPS